MSTMHAWYHFQESNLPSEGKFCDYSGCSKEYSSLRGSPKVFPDKSHPGVSVRVLWGRGRALMRVQEPPVQRSLIVRIALRSHFMCLPCWWIAAVQVSQEISPSLFLVGPGFHYQCLLMPLNRKENTWSQQLKRAVAKLGRSKAWIVYLSFPMTEWLTHLTMLHSGPWAMTQAVTEWFWK